ncbi:hypothetical protein [Methylobacter sp.]|uniref:hypothetical protein n=1 Tax=Methylobacter sp. TaxID=2051955 RepID=UPI002FDED70C
MFAFEELRDNLAYVRIAHHIRGRIRLKLEAKLAVDALPGRQIRQFQAILDRTPGFHSARVNFLARSCVVEYDPIAIPEQAWSDFLSGTDSPAASLLEQILRDTYQEIINAKL